MRGWECSGVEPECAVGAKQISQATVEKKMEMKAENENESNYYTVNFTR